MSLTLYQRNPDAGLHVSDFDRDPLPYSIKINRYSERKLLNSMQTQFYFCVDLSTGKADFLARIMNLDNLIKNYEYFVII